MRLGEAASNLRIPDQHERVGFGIKREVSSRLFSATCSARQAGSIGINKAAQDLRFQATLNLQRGQPKHQFEFLQQLKCLGHSVGRRDKTRRFANIELKRPSLSLYSLRVVEIPLLFVSITEKTSKDGEIELA